MSEIDLAQKFPTMRPIDSVPTLSSTNGFGLKLVGHRDYDEETRSYVKSHVFQFFFLPVLAIGAYRVIDSQQGGWILLGRVPLATRAKVGNFALITILLAAIGIGWWTHHTGTPDYIAGQRIEEADKLAADGKAGQAAQIYREEMTKPTKHAITARTKLAGLVEKPAGALEETALVYRIALDMQRQNDPLVPNLFERGMKLADEHAEADPRGALAVVETLAPIAPKPRDVLAVRRKILERLVADNRKDVDLTSRLAVICDIQGETPRCEELLLPIADQLGERDGAAVLGRIYAGKGNFDAARTLLQPYVKARLPKLQKAEKDYTAAVTRVQQQVKSQLNAEKPPEDFPLAQYNASNKDAQAAIVQQYFSKKMLEDAGLRAAEQSLSDQSSVLSAALDLGMAMLQAAQQRVDPAIRKRELEETEKFFLEMRSVAGETDTYRVNLGQVYYWLGKHADGRKQFEDLLTARKRDGTILLAVSNILREVGDVSEARTLAEEAYNNGSTAEMKQRAAHMRAVMFKDLDDEIVWLDRSDPNALEIKASLSNARGGKAHIDGKDDVAAAHYRNAIAAYDQMPVNAASLNNSSLTHFALYHITQEKDHLIRGMDKIERAVALQSGDSILLSNAASIILNEAVRDVIGDRINFGVLKQQRSGLDLLYFLYPDEAGRRTVIEQVGKHPGTIKSRQYYEKQMILAPKRSESYLILTALHTLDRNVEGLRAVWNRLEKVELDLKQDLEDTMDYYRGKDDPKKAEDAGKAVARHEPILIEARKAGGATFAAAVASTIRGKMTAAVYGSPIDADALVKLAEEADTVAPSAGTKWTLVTALTLRAHRTLIKENPAYASLAKKTERSLGTTLLSYVVSVEGALREKAIANADLKRIAAMRLDLWKKFPADHSPGAWASIVALYPKEAAEMADAIRKDPSTDLEYTIRHKVSPLDASNAMSKFWALRIAGKNDDANELLKQAASRGTPLPVAGN